MSASSASTIGRFLQEQRRLAQLSLREVASMAEVSNAYLSQIERGLHEPSVRVLRSLARALDVPADELGRRGLDPNSTQPAEPSEDASEVEAVIRRDPRLCASQQDSLLSVYRTLVGED